MNDRGSMGMTIAAYGAPSAPGDIEIPVSPEPFVPFVNPPPSYAPDAELAAMAAIVAALEPLDPAARARVLRYCISRWGTP